MRVRINLKKQTIHNQMNLNYDLKQCFKPLFLVFTLVGIPFNGAHQPIR